MSNETLDQPKESTETSTASEIPSVALSPCQLCIASMEGVIGGLIVGGAIVAAPEELTIVAIVGILTAAGLAFGAEDVKKWITQAAKEGIHEINQLARYLCKQAGIC